VIKESFQNPEGRQEEDRKILEATKEAVVRLGLFDEEYLDGLNYKFLDNTGTVAESADEDPERDVDIPPQAMMDMALSRAWWGDRSAVTRIPYIWFGKEDADIWKKMGRLDATIAHELGHPKSFRIFPPEDETRPFPSGAFKKNVLAMDKTELGDTPGLDFNKFEYSVYEWSEIYADLYKREYLRRLSPEGEELIQSYNERIYRSARDLKKAAESLSEEFQMEIDPDLIYKDMHVLVYLLAGIIEKQHPDFEERMKYVESLGRESDNAILKE
jgi:hypothetical protein